MRNIVLSILPFIALIIALLLNTPAHATGVNGNPWNYTFVAAGGKRIYAPDPAFCGQYFHCIPNFLRGKGYVMQCRDGMYSKSGGLSGSCSRHEGDGSVLYAHDAIPVQPVPGSSVPKMSPVLPLTGSDPSLLHR